MSIQLLKRYMDETPKESIESDKTIELIRYLRHKGPVYTDSIVKGLCIETAELDNLLALAKDMRIIQIDISYECADEFHRGVILDAPCKYCGKTIEEHSFEYMIAIDTDFIEELEELRKSILDKICDKKSLRNLEDLNDELLHSVFFVGSGLSLPLGIPDWHGLIRDFLGKIIEDRDRIYVTKILDTNGDVLKAIDILVEKGYQGNSEELKRDIVDYIQQKVQESIKLDNSDCYNEIIRLNENFIFTTNYDKVLTQRAYKMNIMLENKLLSDINSMQDFMLSETGCIINLHGTTDNERSMILSKQDYENFYCNQDNLDKLRIMLNSRFFIFIGFSFKDKYFIDLHDSILKFSNNRHYIIDFNKHEYDIKEFESRNLKVINLNTDLFGSSKDSYTTALKIILKYLNNTYEVDYYCLENELF